MKFVKRDQSLAYVDAWLWVPKTFVNVDHLRRTLVIQSSNEDQVRIAELYKETEDHILVPREFWKYEDLPYELVDCRPTDYQKISVKSKITLDWDQSSKAQSETKTVQREAMEALLASRGGVLQLGCGKGKAQPVDTPVLTPYGWVPIGTLRYGDEVIGSDGKPTKVTGVFPQGRLPVFKVTMEDGTSTRCCDEHLWFTRTPADKKKGNPGQVRPLRDIRKTLRTKAGAQHAVPRTSAVHFAGRDPVYEPWLMGFYLGDGSSGIYHGARRVQFDKPGTELHKKISDALLRHRDGSYLAQTGPKNLTTRVRFEHGESSRIWSELMTTGLVGVSSEEKFIPQKYLRASVAERWELLEGLLDSDGSIVPTGRTYSTSSEKLRDNMVELCRSLGVRVSVEARQTFYTYLGEHRAGRPSWRLYLNHNKWGKGRYNKFQFIQKVEAADEEECVCIQVEAEDSLYVTENFILTHNTVVAIDFICRTGVPAIIMADNTFLLDQWKKELLLHTDITEDQIGWIQGDIFDWKKPIVFATYQTMANRAETLPEEVRRYFGVVVWDEGHHLGAETFSKTATLFYGYRLLLTATPHRDDGMHVIYDFHVGPVIFKDLTPDLKTKVFFLWTGLEPDFQDPRITAQTHDRNGEVHLKMLASFFGQWKEHLAFVINEVKMAREQNRKVLVLSESIDELVNLLAVWKDREDLFSDLPIPTSKDVGEDVPAAGLDKKKREQIEKRLGQFYGMLRDPDLSPIKRENIEKEKIPDLRFLLKRDEVARKIANLLGRRQKQYIKELLAVAGDAGLIIGAVKPEEREEMLSKFPVTFAIMKYGKEGLNSKQLDTAIMTLPVSSKNVLQQVLGRPSRPLPGKKQPVLIVLEHNVGPLIGMCRKMRSHLRSWPHDEGGPFEYEEIGHPKLSLGRNWK